jgi:hypothetical protein
MYGWVRQITDWIFINGVSQTGIKYSIVGMIGLSGL